MTSQSCESPKASETPTQRLASLVLGQDVIAYIDARRNEGRPWRFIARDLHADTDGQIDVTYETLRKWHDGAASSEATA